MSLLIEEALGGGIFRLTLNRPERKNALSVALRDAVTAALNRINGSADAKVVILTGAGGVFSAGFDLKEFERAASDPAFERALWLSSDLYHQALLYFPLPIVAAVPGVAFGGGFDTAVLCDICIAGESARFAHPEAAFAEVVYAPLQERIGGAAARDLCLTGREVRSEEALRLGLVSRVVPDEELAGEAFLAAQAIARSPRAVLLGAKAKIIRRAGISFTATLAL